ncbi:MAG TPA: radical SAM family heme chaperone HemW [Deltaproteobacteria bacterium]|nr:radical SAM family heme chaperone HemW [Deltaproteobacteria bacterium]
MNSQTPNHPWAGLYLHIPFCVKKCPYCDFFSTTDLSLKARFLDTLFKETALVQAGDLSFDTIYLGGGTPSLYNPSEIGGLIDSIHRRFSIQPDTEITLEVNPGTVNRHRLEAYRKAGVNRINIGVQSFQQDQLEFLGRIHSNEEAVETIHAARQSGFINIGIDFIYGLPGQTASSLILDLKKAVSFDPEHLSCYLLTYEPGTRLTHSMNAGQFSPLSDEQTGNLLETTVAYLDANGYMQYEISNFAKSSEFISRHNRKYWDFTPYLGLGPSAHSFFPPERRWNHSSLPPYLADIENGKPPVAGREALTRQQQIMEAIYLGLRKTEGINTEKFERFFSSDFLNMFKDALETLTDDALIVLDSNHCRLSRKGMRFMDSVAKVLVNAGAF